MLYQHVTTLERLGWLTLTVLPHKGVELRRWPDEPVARTREIRLDVLVKVLSPANAIPFSPTGS